MGAIYTYRLHFPTMREWANPKLNEIAKNTQKNLGPILIKTKSASFDFTKKNNFPSRKSNPLIL